MKQTAVEWLVSQLNKQGFAQVVTDEEINQAKEMEKDQIIDSYRDGRSDQQSDRPSKFYNRMAEQYYNETYESK
jgi:predicted GNAT family acetyltransferase